MNSLATMKRFGCLVSAGLTYAQIQHYITVKGFVSLSNKAVRQNKMKNSMNCSLTFSTSVYKFPVAKERWTKDWMNPVNCSDSKLGERLYIWWCVIYWRWKSHSRNTAWIFLKQWYRGLGMNVYIFNSVLNKVSLANLENVRTLARLHLYVSFTVYSSPCTSRTPLPL